MNSVCRKPNILNQVAVKQNIIDSLQDELPEMHNPGSFYFQAQNITVRISGKVECNLDRKGPNVHEEYQPGYHWDDLAEKKPEKQIPWNEFEEHAQKTESARENTHAGENPAVDGD